MDGKIHSYYLAENSQTMNKALWGLNLVLLAIIAFFLFTGFYQQERIAYIDTAQLMDKYEGMKQARAQYQQKAGLWQANVDTLVSEVQQQIKIYEKESTGMTAREKELSQQLIRSKQQQLGEYQKALQEKARQADREMTQQVLATVNAYLAEYGKTNHYQIILAATDAGNIVYAEEGMDITQEVLEGLNKGYAAK